MNCRSYVCQVSRKAFRGNEKMSRVRRAGSADQQRYARSAGAPLLAEQLSGCGKNLTGCGCLLMLVGGVILAVLLFCVLH